jgi:hypothetical protein
LVSLFPSPSLFLFLLLLYLSQDVAKFFGSWIGTAAHM